MLDQSNIEGSYKILMSSLSKKGEDFIPLKIENNLFNMEVFRGFEGSKKLVKNDVHT